MGYDVIMVLKVRLCGKTVYIQIIRTPHTPIIVIIAGVSEILNPRRYPERISLNTVKTYIVNIITSRVYPVSTTSGLLSKIAIKNLPKVSAIIAVIAVAIASCIRHINIIFLQRSICPAP